MLLVLTHSSADPSERDVRKNREDSAVQPITRGFPVFSKPITVKNTLLYSILKHGTLVWQRMPTPRDSNAWGVMRGPPGGTTLVNTHKQTHTHGN